MNSFKVLAMAALDSHPNAAMKVVTEIKELEAKTAATLKAGKSAPSTIVDAAPEAVSAAPPRSRRAGAIPTGRARMLPRPMPSSMRSRFGIVALPTSSRRLPRRLR